MAKAQTQTQNGGTIWRQTCEYAHAGFTLILKLCDVFRKKEKKMKYKTLADKENQKKKKKDGRRGKRNKFSL